MKPKISRLIAVLGCSIMALSFAACGKEPAVEAMKAQEPQTVTAEDEKKPAGNAADAEASMMTVAESGRKGAIRIPDSIAKNGGDDGQGSEANEESASKDGTGTPETDTTDQGAAPSASPKAGGNGGNSNINATTTGCTHNWVEDKTVVHHDAVTHTEDQGSYKEVCVQEGHYGYETTTVPVLTCTCGAQFDSYEAWSAHAAQDTTGETCWDYGILEKEVQTPVWVDPIYETQWVPNIITVVDSAAWDEEVVAGYHCSICGAAK